MSQHDRDLAEAIYHEITSDVWTDAVLSLLREYEVLGVAAEDAMRRALSIVASSIIDTVLARRLREAARTGPWEEA